jgi:hypothetical protein
VLYLVEVLEADGERGVVLERVVVRVRGDVLDLRRFAAIGPSLALHL